MAEVIEYRLNVTFIMTNVNAKSKKNVESTFSTRIKPAAGQAYIAAADTAARSATDVGKLIHQTNLLSLGTLKRWGVQQSIEESTALPPAPPAKAYPFDKFAISSIAAGEALQVTIPARDMSVVSLETDGVTVKTGTPIPDDWIAAYQLIALDEDGSSPTVQRIFVLK